jgi:hypothetical protein
MTRARGWDRSSHAAVVWASDGRDIILAGGFYCFYYSTGKGKWRFTMRGELIFFLVKEKNVCKAIDRL